MDLATRDFVRQRAGLHCEYCQLPESLSPLARLQIEHIRPIKHGGTDDVENLALACIDCNLRKGPNLSGIDPETDMIEPLFYPRVQTWEEHFRWEGARIVGASGCGRATVAVMDFNMLDRVQVRLAMLRARGD
jgi:5-methylcytosine-specific restriction endonuclease McrA